MTKPYRDIYYNASDGLKLYARDYPNANAKQTILCMHGLTRNSADFHTLALHLNDHYRVISVDQRGRGQSEYDNKTENYTPLIYCQDMFALIAHLGLENIIAVGTSMGGLMAMVMNTMKPGVFDAVIMNDIGPIVDEAGLDRIRGYVGATGPFTSWDEVVNSVKQQGPDVFPRYTDKDWMAFAKRTCEERGDGKIYFAYDPAISEGLKTQDTSAVPPDLWPAFESFGDTPVLVVRGAISDILSTETLSEMCSRLPDCGSAQIPNIGHAPMLDEPESLNTIDSFLARIS